MEEAVVNIISSGGFSALAIYLIVYVLPRQLKEYKSDLKEQREVFLKTLSEERASRDNYSKNLEAAVKAFESAHKETSAELILIKEILRQKE